MLRVACIYLPPSTPVQEFAESCLRFTPQIALGERAIFLEIGACHKLYSEASFVQRAKVLLSRFQTSGIIAIANDIPSAISMAVYGKSNRRDLPIEALEYYASPFHRDPLFQKAIEAFRHLGIETLGALLDLPRQSLGSRFHKELIFALHRIDTSMQIPWPRFIPKEKIFESTAIDSELQIATLEPIGFLLKRLVDKALLRVRGRGELASGVEIRVSQEKYSTIMEPLRAWPFDLAYPQATAISLMPILLERLDRALQKTPLEAPIRFLEFAVTQTSPGRGRQRDFFSNREEEFENFRSVVNRLSERLGFDRAFMASLVESYFPEKSWKKTLEPPNVVKESLPQRPLRILSTPKKLRRLDDFFAYRGKRWKIKEIFGPERLTGEWWFGEKERDYFRVVTYEGEQLWIYSLGEAKEYFLHGIFD